MNSLAKIRSALCENPINYHAISDALKQARPDEKEMLVQYLASHVKKPPPAWIAGERKVFEIGETYFPMRWIPAGKFWMGSDDDDKEAYDDEKPMHEVTIARGFWMGETPVTQGQYQSVMAENPSNFKSAGVHAPVDTVSWYNAAAFANELSRLEGTSACFEGWVADGLGDNGIDYLGCNGWRLPTEAEWEYACRAGTTAPRYGDLSKIAWYAKNSNYTTHPVGEKKANGWGLYDMLGNVWELCYDWYDGESYKNADKENFSNLRNDETNGRTTRALRGGSWFSIASNARCALRGEFSPYTSDTMIGFRLVRGV